MFKSHSFAQAYPTCYDIKNPADAKLMTREDFLETFLDALRELRPKYAVPFASMVAFLHPESRHCNVCGRSGRRKSRPPRRRSDVAATTEDGADGPGRHVER